MKFIFNIKNLLLISLVLVSQYSFAQVVIDSFALRAKILQDYIANVYTPPSINIGDPEKYYYPKAMARFNVFGANDSAATAIIDAFKTKSPFHFTLVGMARIMSDYKNVPVMKKNRLSYLKQVWKRNDSYNCWTAEGTENHINMSRTSGYLYAQYALDYPNEFPDAPHKLQLMKDWMLYWSKKIYEGGTGEWNSSIYEQFNLLGWLNIYDFAKDPEVKLAAKAVIDYYAIEIALNYTHGIIGGSEMRGVGCILNIDYVAWLWFGDDNYRFEKDILNGSNAIQCVHLINSTYRPHKSIAQLARKEYFKIPEYYIGSKSSYLFEKQSFIKQFLFLDKNFSIGCGIVPYAGYTGATYQVVTWKLVGRSKNGKKPIVASGNGRTNNEWTGKTKDPYTQVVQHKNVLIQMTKQPKNYKEIEKTIDLLIKKWNEDWKKDFATRFPTEKYKEDVVNGPKNKSLENKSYISFSKNILIREEKGRIFVESDNVYLQLIPFTKNTLKVAYSKPELTTLATSAKSGLMCGFILEVINANDYESFNEFIVSAIKKSKIKYISNTTGKVIYQSMSNDVIETQFTENGTVEEAIVDWGYGPTKQQVKITSPPFLQPVWPSGLGFGRIPTLKINNVETNFNEKWPVINGPKIDFNNSILKMKDFIIDYSQRLPIYTSN